MYNTVLFIIHVLFCIMYYGSLARAFFLRNTGTSCGIVVRMVLQDSASRVTRHTIILYT